jgi:ATP-binding cassette, subfamily B, bacterial
MKNEIWKQLYRLIAPHRGRFVVAVSIALLSTGANLVEPLVYREAINDIAGLFEIGRASCRERVYYPV